MYSCNGRPFVKQSPEASGTWHRDVRSPANLRKVLTGFHSPEGLLDQLTRSKAEAEDKITLASLRKLANALDCELQYNLVPRKPLQEILVDRAHALARERLLPVSHSMSLENQAVEEVASEKQLQLLAKEILDGSRRNLW